MSSSLPIYRVLEIVKSILDNVKCLLCGKSDGSRYRYSCGHTVCDECMIEAEVCVFCIAPPIYIDHNKLKIDAPLSLRVKNANNLLNTFQDTFHADVYKRQRVSEQLKIEREVFPECIQAPVKYYNKRRSNITVKDKENRFHSILPGEVTSPPKEVKMKKTTNIVEKWLNQSETFSRRALSDLNVNQYSSKSINSNILNSRKRIHSSSPNKKHSNKMVKIKRQNTTTNILQNSNLLDGKKYPKCEHEESGIVLDDETVYIDDSQSQIIDKDKLALLAVEAADKEMLCSMSLQSLEVTQEISPSEIENKSLIMFKPVKETLSMVVGKVPFYKKGILLETCTYCEENKDDAASNIADDSQNISISIDNKNFLTTINISNCNVIINHKNSVYVQTDISDVIAFNDTSQEKQNIPDLPKHSVEKDIKSIENVKKNIHMKSKDMFLNDVQWQSSTYDKQLLTHESKYNIKAKDESHLKEKLYKKSNVIINDSDSDTNSEEAKILKVSADIHRTPDSFNYGILDEICTKGFMCRSRKKVRGPTPDSSNSSEKENCDPNKMKKRKANKKKKSLKLFI